MTVVQHCAASIRTAALSGTDAAALLDLALDCLGEAATPFTFIAVLRTAFEIRLQTLRDLENWDRLHPKGDMSTLEVIAVLEPIIREFRAHPH